jgi:hypothetical protein
MQIFISIVGIFLMMSFLVANIDEPHPKNSDSELSRIFNATSKYAKEKYGLKSIGTGVSSPARV